MAPDTISTQTSTSAVALAVAANPDPDALLTRRQAAAALTAAGYPTAPATLARKASVGGGPVYRLYSSRVVYRWGDLVAWAQSLMSPPVRSTAELETARHDRRTSAAKHAGR